MSSNSANLSKLVNHPAPIPPLETGDLLSRDEFEHRYHRMPDISKAELIEGVVYMPSPVRWNQHAAPHADFMTFLGTYRAYTPGVRVGDNGSLRLDMDNEPQPDAAMIILPACGGQVRLSEDDFVQGAPELVAEIASSSVSIDLNRKRQVYRRNQIREYAVWRVLDGALDWYVLRGSDFEKLPSDSDGIVRSEVFPGLWLNVPALLDGDMAAVLEVLQQGLAGELHQAFCIRLQGVV